MRGPINGFERHSMNDKGHYRIKHTMESLILAQDERWRRALYMQVKENVFFGKLLNWRTGE